MTQPTCQYFLLKNPHEPTVIPLSFFITLLSTVINFLGFYVILYKSKKETKLFKFTLFGNLVSVWLENIFKIFIPNTRLFSSHSGYLKDSGQSQWTRCLYSHFRLFTPQIFSIISSRHTVFSASGLFSWVFLQYFWLASW